METVNTIEETRRARLDVLLRTHGSFAELNEKLGWPRTDSRLSRIKNQNSRTDRDGKVFQMGSPMAREIEASLGLETGWMDTPLTWAESHGEHDLRAELLQVMETMSHDKWQAVLSMAKTIANLPTQAAEPVPPVTPIAPAEPVREPVLMDLLVSADAVRQKMKIVGSRAARTTPPPADAFDPNNTAKKRRPVKFEPPAATHFYADRKKSRLFESPEPSNPPPQAERVRPAAPKH